MTLNVLLLSLSGLVVLTSTFIAITQIIERNHRQAFSDYLDIVKMVLDSCTDRDGTDKLAANASKRRKEALDNFKPLTFSRELRYLFWLLGFVVILVTISLIGKFFVEVWPMFNGDKDFAASYPNGKYYAMLVISVPVILSYICIMTILYLIASARKTMERHGDGWEESRKDLIKIWNYDQSN